MKHALRHIEKRTCASLHASVASASRRRAPLHIAAGNASLNFPSGLEKHRKLCYDKIRKAVEI
jgi:hypothetical protein